jgi:hypothetical protein
MSPKWALTSLLDCFQLFLANQLTFICLFRFDVNICEIVQCFWLTYIAPILFFVAFLILFQNCRL